MNEKKKRIHFAGLNRSYWLYWTASSLSMAASNILQYILSLYVLDLTGSGTLFASMLSIIIFPRLFLTPLAGVISDRHSRNRVMAGVLLFETAVLVAAFFAGELFGVRIFLVYAVVVLLEMGEVFYNASSAAIIPELVPGEQIKDAIAISKIDDGIVVVAAPMAAALIYQNVRVSAAFLLVALLDFFSFLLHRAIRPQYAEARSEETAGRKSVMGDFLEGLHYIRRDRFLNAFIKILPVVNAFFGATFSVSVMYLLREKYHLSAYTYGLYNSITASTSLIVPLVIIPLLHRWRAERTYALATTLISSEILIIGLVAQAGLDGRIPIPAAVAAITILDCMTIAEAVPMQISSSVMLQTKVEKGILGRVSATIRMVSIVSVAAGEMLFGVLNDRFSAAFPIYIGAAGVGVASVLFWTMLQGNDTDPSGRAGA